MHPNLRAVGMASALAICAASLALPAAAQPHAPPQGGHDHHDDSLPPGYEPGYVYGAPETAPPDGYTSRHRAYDRTYRARDEDRRYADAVQRWAAENCVDERDRDKAAGAVIGGVLGAIIGSNVAGRGDRAEGAVIGGMVGALAGSAIGASSSSPGCPPRYVMRRGAQPFRPPAFRGGYAYAAPPGYRPWIWNGGRWSYQPYPYHRYWYEHERSRGGYDHRRD